MILFYHSSLLIFLSSKNIIKSSSYDLTPSTRVRTILRTPNMYGLHYKVNVYTIHVK